MLGVMRSIAPLLATTLALVTTACAHGGAATPDCPKEPAAMAEKPVHHSINYLELGVTDLAAAKAFYAAAFGWGFNDYGPTYAGIQKVGGEGEAGGLRLEAEVKTGGPLLILYSADLEASLQAVKAAGGTITREIFDFPGGRRFHFTDPSGNELAVWGEAAAG